MTHDDTPDRRALELPATGHRIGRAVDDELAFHIEEQTRELVAAGIDPATARARAVASFGDLQSAREELRRIDEVAARRTRWTEAFTDLLTDAGRTLRALGRRPGYLVAATLTLGLGIGANSSMFALVDRLLLSPPPHIENGDEVVRLVFNEAQSQAGRITWGGAPFGYFRTLQEAQIGFDVAGSVTLAVSLRASGETRGATVEALTPGYFALLGTRPARGRLLSDSAFDGRSVVISHALWSREFAEGDDAVGRDLVLGTETFRVVGVAPRGFTGVRIEPVDAWISLGPTTPGLPAGWEEAPNDRRLSLIARPRANSSLAVVAGEATQLYLAARAGAPEADSTARVLLTGLTPGRQSAGGVTPEARVALWLQGVSLLVLLIAVANVANLLLLRAIDRRRETAVYMALGVGRIRLARHVVLESLLLGVCAAVLAVLLTRLTGPLLWRVLLPTGAEASTTPWRDAAVVGALALASVLAMTIVPVLMQLRTPANDVLRNASRGTSRRGSRLGDVLVVAQVACALILLVGSGLFVNSLFRLSSIELGFELDRVIGVRIEYGDARGDSALIGRVLRDAEARVRDLPGVVSVGTGLTAPYRPSLTLPVFLPGHDQLPGVGENALGYPSFFVVNPSFLPTLGISMVQGRGFETIDAASAPRVAIVDATMARTFWPGQDAIGQCIRVGADTAPCRTVVGVAEDSKRTITSDRHALRYYLPLEQVPTLRTERYLFARTAASPQSMLSTVRAAVSSVSSTAFVEVFPMTQLLDPYTKPWRLGRVVFVAFGVLATVIATIGLYGVIAFGVANRRRELGIRLALGATRASVLGSVVRAAGTRTAIGSLVGIAGALLLGRRLEDLLFRTSPTDPIIFIGALSVVAMAALVACALPAWRAARVDPTVSLKAE
jgi:putative ABC transport system permease protein